MTEHDLPPGWVQVRLDEIAEVRLGRQRSPKNHTGDQMRPYLRAANLTWSGIDTLDVKTMNFTDDEVATYRLMDGDILLSEASGSADEVGKPGIWRGQLAGDTCFQNTLLRVRPAPDIDSEYLYYQLLQTCLSGGFARSSRGVGIHHLGAARLSTLPVPLPPSQEQVRVSLALNQALGVIDASVRDLIALGRRLTSLRMVVSSRATSGRLAAGLADSTGVPLELADLARRRAATGRKAPSPPAYLLQDLPPGWTCVSIDQIAERIDYGSSAKAHEEPGQDDVPILRMGNIRDGRVLYERLKYLPADHPDSRTLVLQDGDLLFNRTNSPELVGKTAVFDRQDERFTWASYLIRVRLLPGVDPGWVALAINSPRGREYVASVVSQQVGQANVNGTKLRAFPIPLPPHAVQREILTVVEEYGRLVATLRTGLSGLLMRCNKLRRAVLRAALGGELVPQNPDDEPAELLLKRIAEERAAAPTVTRRGRRAVPAAPTVGTPAAEESA